MDQFKGQPNLEIVANNIEKKINLPVQVIILCGLQGSGKSTVGRILGARTNLQLLLSDRIRKEIFQNPSYSSLESTYVYSRMIAMALENLNNGLPVVLDATHTNQRNREAEERIFKLMGYLVKVVYIKAPSDTIVKERIENRTNDFSDADYEIYLRTKTRFIEPTNAIVINNNGSIADLQEQVENVVQELVFAEC